MGEERGGGEKSGWRGLRGREDRGVVKGEDSG